MRAVPVGPGGAPVESGLVGAGQVRSGAVLVEASMGGVYGTVHDRFPGGVATLVDPCDARWPRHRRSVTAEDKVEEGRQQLARGPDERVKEPRDGRRMPQQWERGESIGADGPRGGATTRDSIPSFVPVSFLFLLQSC